MIGLIFIRNLNLSNIQPILSYLAVVYRLVGRGWSYLRYFNDCSDAGPPRYFAIPARFFM